MGGKGSIGSAGWALHKRWGMEIRAYQRNNPDKLFAYWRKVGEDIPYFFPVAAPTWQTCLLEDEWAGEAKFTSLETYVAREDGRMLGFVQWGQPRVAWTVDGQKDYGPDMGVIRHLYFDEGQDDAGDALLAKACDGVARFDRKHAFYHIFGMSCNAHHGKLHSSQSHVERCLRAYGFQTEHENAYYVLDMTDATPLRNARLRLRGTGGAGEERFEARVHAEVVGTARVRTLDALTGGYTRDTAYLTWIGVPEQVRGQGVGTEFLRLLVQLLLGRGYRYLHTDTASGNVRARRLYARLGFRERGLTRSYVQA